MMAKEASLRATKCYDAGDMVLSVQTSVSAVFISLVLGEGCGTAQHPNNILYARRSVPGQCFAACQLSEDLLLYPLWSGLSALWLIVCARVTPNFRLPGTSSS